ncbi:MAG: hypothetical protein DMF88_13450 [Acidobacteria bacterium]|nr:MAG: hypothetical protein DMF88_13450 [Acidobacteriota bacterium]
MRLKKYYSSREVASLTGLTARQLQWWDTRRLFLPAIAPQRTEAGVLADLRRRGFSIPRLRRLLSTLREAFGVRLYEAIGEGGPLTLFIGGDQLFARTVEGHLYNLDRPQQALMMVGEELPLRPLTARERRKRTKGPVVRVSGSGKLSRGRRRDAR